ncbi:hypothetical protein M5585_19680 [Serratia ureilytica]
MSPQAALLFCCCSRFRCCRSAVSAASRCCSRAIACSLASVRLSTFHTLWRNASRFFWYSSVTLLSFGGAAWYSKSTRACAKQHTQGRTGQHYPFHQ